MHQSYRGVLVNDKVINENLKSVFLFVVRGVPIQHKVVNVKSEASAVVRDLLYYEGQV